MAARAPSSTALVPTAPGWTEPADLDVFARQVLGDNIGPKWLDERLPVLGGRAPRNLIGTPGEERARDILRAVIIGAA